MAQTTPPGGIADIIQSMLNPFAALQQHNQNVLEAHGDFLAAQGEMLRAMAAYSDAALKLQRAMLGAKD